MMGKALSGRLSCIRIGLVYERYGSFVPVCMKSRKTEMCKTQFH